MAKKGPTQTTGLKLPLPKLKWSDGEWTAEIVLPAWKGFLSRLGPYTSASSKRKSIGKARLRVLTEDDARVEPTPEQQRAWADLMANQEAVRDAMLRAIVKEYARFRRESANMLDDPMFREIYGDLPKQISEPDELRGLVGLSSVYIHPAAEGGVAYVGYGFGCEWEDEHGLGVMTHRRRVLAVGHEEVAFMGDVYAQQRPAKKKSVKKARGPLVSERLIFEVNKGNLSRVKKLLASGASPEKYYDGPGSFNAIEVAAINGHAAILTLLLEHAKKPVKVGPIGFYIKQKPEIRKILQEYGVKEKA